MKITEKAAQSLDTWNRLSLEMNEVYGRAAKSFGISDTCMLILYALLYEEHLSQADITRLCGLPKQTIGSALKKMEQDSILHLVQAKGKRKEIKLSEKGRKLAEKTAGKVIQAEQNAFQHMSESERKEFLRLNKLYLSELKKEMEEMENGNQTV